MAVPARRAQRRYPCDVPVEVLSFVTETRVAQGRFSNLSVGGAMLHCANPLERGITFLFRFTWKSARLALPGRVIWTAPRDLRDPAARRYGVQLNLTRDQEGLLRELLESLRLAEKPPAREVRDYWKPRARP